MNCPKCNKENNDNWPITVNNNIVDGGCQDCWETEIDDDWWNTLQMEV